MQTKITKYLELEDDKENILRFIKEEASKEKIDIYVDYRDTEDLEKIVTKHKTLDEFKCEIEDAYIDAECEQQNEITRMIADRLLEKYPEADKISDDLAIVINDYVCAYTPIYLPINMFLNSTIRVNIFVKFDKSNDAWEDEFDYTTLIGLLKRLGYKKPKTILKNLRIPNYKICDPFLRSIQNEMYNAYTNQINLLCFIGKITIKEYYKCIENPNTIITFPKNVTCGFVDPYNGGGSILGIKLPRDLSIKYTNVAYTLVENSNQHYTVDDIYGLTGECYKELKIK